MRNYLAATLLLGDALVLVVSFFLTIFLGFGFLNHELINGHLLPFIFLYFLWISVLYLYNLYEEKYFIETLATLRQVGYALFTCLVTGALFFYLTPFFAITPKTNLLLNTLIFGVVFILWRRFFSHWFLRFLSYKILVLDDEDCYRHIVKDIEADNLKHVEVILLNTNNLEDIKIPRATYAVIGNQSIVSAELLQRLYHKGTEIISPVELYEKLFFKIPISFLSSKWFIDHITTEDRILKNSLYRLFEIVFALILLIVTSPFILIASVIISVDGVNPVYTQTRIGKRGKPFTLFKLRTMKIDAEKNGATWANGARDPRVTPVGKILRKSHLDEVLQMINVIKGDLALVGPRPERPEFVQNLEEEIPYYNLRHIIKPGFTGWAQIKYHYAGNTAESRTKFEFDLYYLKNRNWFLDLGIVLKTIQIVVTH